MPFLSVSEHKPALYPSSISSFSDLLWVIIVVVGYVADDFLFFETEFLITDDFELLIFLPLPPKSRITDAPYHT